MRRWNAWGDDAHQVELPKSGLDLLERTVGPLRPTTPAPWEATLAAVPASTLPDHPLLDRSPGERVRHAVGQSFPDWLAIRTNTVPRYPDGVASPRSGEDVAELLRFARDNGAIVVPYGGGTSVAGHLRVERPERPVLCCSLARMNRLLDLDAVSGLATFEAGVNGPAIEAALGAHGWTLGHYPQSWELSTLGGWVATRSSGQLSLEYGRIEGLFAGGTVETPSGRLELPVHPASAAGPDLRQLVMGSEGRLGVITRCVVRVSPRPERESFRGAVFAESEAAMAAIREVLRAGVDLNMMRLSLPRETRTHLALGGDPATLAAVARLGEGSCLLTYGATGRAAHAEAAFAEAEALFAAHGGALLGDEPGARWKKGRFAGPYLREPLWSAGLATDTLETSVPWSRVSQAVERIEEALRGALPEEKVHAFTHLSHVYSFGSSLYTTYAWRLHGDPEIDLDRWRRLKAASSRAVVSVGGTISHQHGVGQDHRPYLEAEKGKLGIEMLRGVVSRIDPEGLMNNGNLIPDAEA